MTLDEMIEWSEISASVSQVVKALEECSICKRITECESVPGVEGYFCKVCICESVLIRAPKLSH